MGMDVHGKKPKVNKSIDDFPTLSKWNDTDWGERDGKDWEADRDKYWKEDEEWNKANPGIYFRANVWWWRPLWDFCAHHCPDIIDQKTYDSGHYNDGAGLDEVNAIKLGIKLIALIEDGVVTHHENEVRMMNEQAKKDDPENQLAGAYPFSVECVQKFAEFCIESGGFEID